MKLHLIKFILWLYETHIQEDWDDYTKLGKIVVYPAWFIRSFLIWLTFPLWIPAYSFSSSKVFKAYEEFGQLTPEQMRELNRRQTREFLARKANNKK